MDVSYFQSEEFLSLATTYGIRIAGVLLLFFVASLVASWVRHAVYAAMIRARIDETLSRFASKTARWGILILAALTCLSIFGIQTTSFAAVIGAAGIAIGLAFQGTLSNFSSGIMLLVFRPFKIGDVVTVGGNTGTVFEIDLFSTTMDTGDNRRFVVPNSSVFGSTIENITYHPKRRVDIAIGVDYSADLDKTREVLTKAAESIPDRLDDPEIKVVLGELGASSVDWTVRVWATTENFWAVREAGLEAVKKALDEAGIGIPYPQMDVHLDRTSE